MTILIDIRTLMDERYSGVAEYVFELLTALFAIDTVNRYILYYNSAADVSARIPVFNRPNVRVIHTRYPNKIFNYPLLKLLRRPRFDRLVDEPIDLFFMPHLNFAAWSPRVMSVLTIHDLSFLRFPEVFNWRKNLWHWLLGVKSLMRRVNHIVAVSENTRTDVFTVSKPADTRVTTILSGVSPAFKELSADEPRLAEIKHKYNLPERFVFFLGTVEPRKNIESLIEAFALAKKHPALKDVKLIIAGGRGWKSRPIYTLAAASACNADIRFLDYVDKGDKPYLYNLAEVFVYPSLYEGFGHPPLEAMACGTPVIASTASSLPEVTADTAVLVDPYNPSALATALETVLTDRVLAQNLGEAGRQRAKGFSWEKTAQMYVKLFESLTHGQAR